MFMPPEVMTGDGALTNKVDVYAFGVFLCAIFSNSLTFGFRPPKSIHQLMTNIVKGLRFVRPEGMPDALWNLASVCWLQEPDQRPTFAEITRRMIRSDDFAIPGTDLADYHEYRTRIMREAANRPRIDPAPILAQLRSLGADADSIPGIHP
jgi:hypothetical protein